MTDSRGTFETYPYDADAQNPAEIPQDPPPAAMQPRMAPPPQVSPPPVDRSSAMGRRLLLGLAAAAGVAVAGGAIFNAANRPAMPGMPGDWPPDDEQETDEPEPEEEPGYASLETGFGSLGVEVPVGWSVESEGEFLLLVHEKARLSARSPDRKVSGAGDLAREADYLRDEFQPGGKPTVLDDSDTLLTVLIQTTEGHLGGEKATEQVTLLAHVEQELSLVISWVAVEGAGRAAAEARGMARQLQRSFESP